MCAYVIPYGCLLLCQAAAREKRPEIRGGLHYLLGVPPTRMHAERKRERENQDKRLHNQQLAG